MMGFIHFTIQGTVKSLMLQGLSREEAIKRVESILRTKLPESIKERIND